MSQLDTALTSLEADHAAFITKGQGSHTRTLNQQATARTIADTAMTERDTAQANRTTVGTLLAETVTARQAAEAAMASTGVTYRAAHAARREVAEAVREANIAKHKADALAAGNLDRYGHWLLNTPVANGTLKLDFANQVYQVWENGQVKDKLFSEVMTFTRASTKWVWNGTGTLVEVPVDQPAYDHDPLTGEALGVLIEPGATNLVPASEVFSDWTVSEASVSGGFPSLDGDLTASKLVASTVDTVHSIKKSVSGGADGGVTSLYAKQAGYTGIALSWANSFWLDNEVHVSLVDGSVSHTGGAVTSVKAESVSNGWFRISFVTSVADTSLRIGVLDGVSRAYAGDGTSGIYIWGAQRESGPVATSYIPTAGAAVTRAEDNMYRALGAEYNSQAGTWIVAVNNSREADVLTGAGHWNRAVSGSGTYVFSYDANDAWIYAPNSLPVRFGRQGLDAALVELVEAGIIGVDTARYSPYSMGEAEATTHVTGDLVMFWDIDSSHYTRTSFDSEYRYKYNIDLVPAGLFDNTPNVTSFNRLFFNSQLTKIPAGLFDNTPNVTFFNDVFLDNDITAIPAGLFDNNPQVSSFHQAFYSNPITSIPAGLFNNNPSVQTFRSTFDSNPITSIPAGLFDSSVNAANFYGTFRSTQVTAIPSGLFDNTVGTSFEQTFRGSKITEVPAGLFNNVPNVTTFSYGFQGCPLTIVPAGLFDTQTVCTNYNSAFSDSALDQASVDNVLVSVNLSATTNNLSNGVLGIVRGTNATPSQAGLDAKASLEALGWTVTTN